MLRIDHAQLVAAGDEHQRAVELVDLVEKDRHVHRSRLGHVVVALPGSIVLMPLPHVAIECHLAVDLELMHVHRFAEELHYWFHHPRMASETREWSAVQMRGEIRAHRVAAFLAHVLRPMLRVQRRHFVDERLDLRGAEMARQENIAVAIERLELGICELHVTPLLCGRARSCYATPSMSQRRLRPPDAAEYYTWLSPR